MKPLISVIVPIYKVETYLRQCVDSIRNQTYSNLEIILVDDGSPDGCPTICDEYAQKDPRIRVIHKENGGLSDARNAGLDICTGEFIGFVDSDDVLPHDALENLQKLAFEENAQLIIGGHSRFEDEPPVDTVAENKYTLMNSFEAMEDFFAEGCAAWARLYRREIHENLLFPAGEINEDEAIVLKLLERCSRIVKTNRTVYYYRCRSQSITTTSFSIKKLAWLKHCRDNLAFVREKYPQLEEQAKKRYRSSLLWSMSEICLVRAGYESQWKALKRELNSSLSALWKTAVLRDKMLMILFATCPRGVCGVMIRKWRTR